MDKLGIHPFGHDSAVAFIDHANKDIRTFSLERLTRFKHDYRFVEPLLKDFFPIEQDTKIIFAMREVSPDMIEHFNKKFQADINLKKYKKILHGNYPDFIKFIQIGLNSPMKLAEMASFKRYLDVFLFKEDMERFSIFFCSKFSLKRENLYYYDHHFSHACSAYYFAPESFENDCLVVTIDGQGDGAFSKVFTVAGNDLKEVITSSRDSSICLLYSIFTHILGFMPSADEGKIEAWACYGNIDESNDLYCLLADTFIIKDDFSIGHNKNSDFPFGSISSEYNPVKSLLLEYKKKMKEEDFSAVIQLFFENFFLEYVKKLKIKFNVNRMAFAGGAFANVKLNLRIIEGSGLEEIFVFPAMGDEGTALGALAYSDFKDGIDVSWLRNVKMPYFGPSYSNNEVLTVLKENRSKIKYEYIGEYSYKILARKIAERKICGLFRGRMEFGPRALGHRSILAASFDSTIRDEINLKFKKRQWFQPFCPSMLEEERERLLKKSYNNKHMTCAFRIKDEFIKKIAAVAHVDGTARAQFVEKEDDEFFYNLLVELKKLTGFGVVLNTSFNIHGKAMVMTPQDAIDDFFACGIDYLFMEGYVVERK